MKSAQYIDRHGHAVDKNQNVHKPQHEEQRYPPKESKSALQVPEYSEGNLTRHERLHKPEKRQNWQIPIFLLRSQWKKGGGELFMAMLNRPSRGTFVDQPEFVLPSHETSFVLLGS